MICAEHIRKLLMNIHEDKNIYRFDSSPIIPLDRKHKNKKLKNMSNGCFEQSKLVDQINTQLLEHAKQGQSRA